MKKKLWMFLLLPVLICHAAFAADYAKEIQKCVRKAIGSDFDQYQYLSAPIDNFGTGTMYPKAAKGDKFNIKTAGLFGDPETWWTVEDPKQIPAQLALLRPSGNGGGIAAKCDKSTKFDLAAVLPNLFQLLTLNAKFDYKKNVKVQVSFSSIEWRTLNWSTLAKDHRTKLIDQDVANHLGAHDFLITIGDVVLHEYTAQLTLDKSLDANAKAQLTSAWKAFAKDSSLTADFSDASSGTFKLTAKNPVVAAVYVGEPPLGVSLEKATKDNVPAVLLGKSVLSDIATVKPSKIQPKK